MPYHVEWADEEHSIILCRAEGRWTWEEYHLALDQVFQLARQADYRVDVISLRAPGSVQPSGSGMPHFRRAGKLMPPNVRRSILVTGNEATTRTSQSLLQLLMNNFIQSFTILTTLDEALAFIERDRQRQTT